MSDDGIKFPITERSTVTLHLSLALEDGMVAESTFDGEPLTIQVGDGSLDHGLELGLYGLTAGETQRLTLDPGQAFGPYDPERVRLIERAAFAKDMTLEPGVIIGFATEAGEELPGMVLEAGEEQVKVDFNHPLAGRTIVYDVEILDVIPADTSD